MRGRLVGVLLAVGAMTACDETRGISPDGESPEAPRSLQVSSRAGAVTLTWKPGPDWAGEPFRIYEKSASARDYVALAEVTDCTEGVCTFTDLDARPGVDHDYHVVTVGFDGVESHSSGALRVFVAPVAPGTAPTDGDAAAPPGLRAKAVYDHFARPELSGFRFRVDDGVDPRVSGNDPSRHFRVEVDEGGWWLVPGRGVGVYPLGFLTTDLRCESDADSGCVELTEVPASGYLSVAVGLVLGTTYVVRAPDDDGVVRYGAIRIEALDFDQAGDALVLFDWVWKLQTDTSTRSRTTLAGIVGP